MARVFNSEKSQFMQQATEIYHKNKVGQYSKYLDSNPIFITYYSLNMVQSRTGSLGQVYDELGPNSPLRYNKITELPVYRVQQLQPQGNYEDGNYDVEIDISDMTILPNTVRPRPSDFFCIALPNCKKLLFRVNNFRNNTIQSNDFYSVDADLRDDGEHCCDEIEMQVVESYHCVFENIGTQDNCLIKLDDEAKASDTMSTIETLSAMYHDLFYHDEIGDYIFCPENSFGFHHDHPSSCYYDIYLAKFINDSMLFFTGDYASTSVVTYDDNLPKLFEFMFKHTLWHALITKNTSLLSKYPYFFGKPITKTFSPIIYYINGQCYGFDLVLDSKTKQNRPDLAEYFPHKLIGRILGDDSETTEETPAAMDFNIVDLDNISAAQPKMIQHGDSSTGPTYITKAKNNTNNVKPVVSETNPSSDDNTDMVYDMVCNYFSGNQITFDTDTLVNTLYHYTLWSYHMIPVIIFILKSVYSGYFKSTL